MNHLVGFPIFLYTLFIRKRNNFLQIIKNNETNDLKKNKKRNLLWICRDEDHHQLIKEVQSETEQPLYNFVESNNKLYVEKSPLYVGVCYFGNYIGNIHGDNRIERDKTD